MKNGLGVVAAAVLMAVAGCSPVRPTLGYPGQYPRAVDGPDLPRAGLGLRALPEWTPCRWFVVALPCPGEREESPEEWVGRWKEVLSKAAGAARVVLLANEDRLDELTALAEAWEEMDDEADVVFAVTGSPWLRDYGPIFARGREGRIYAVDPLRADPRGATEGSWDEELMPLRLVEFLAPRGAGLALLPIPLFLDGGDLLTDGQGTAFTSRETLLKNGADRANLERIFARCFGCSRVVVLESLPGPVARHIDLFVKIADERTVLVGQYGPGDQLAPPLNLLQRQAHQALERNALLLRREWASAGPGRRILRVPMPDLSIERREAEAAARRGGEKEGAPAEPKQEKKREGPAPSRRDGREGGQSGRAAPSEVIVYRTYLNCLFIKGSHNVLLVPSYGVVDKKIESAAHEALGKIYGECHGKTEVFPFPSEPEIRSGGSIHCVAITVP